jgi:hypothetical protein
MTLTSIAQDYEGWRQMHEQENSVKEQGEYYWNTWRTNILIPYLKSMSGGGNIYSMGPVLEDFFVSRSMTPEGGEIASKIEMELTGYLGHSLDDKVLTLGKIVSFGSYPHVEAYYSSLKRRLRQQDDEKIYNTALVDNAINTLKIAIESRNPIALEAALRPGWSSVAFTTSPEYKVATKLLSELIN